MNSARKTLIGLATLWVWVAAQNAWAATDKTEKDAFIEGIEKSGFTSWSVEMGDKSGGVEIQLVDGGKAVQLRGPAVAGLEGKANESRVQLELVSGKSALHIQGPVTSIVTNEFLDDVINRRTVLAYLPTVQSKTFVVEFDIMGTGGIDFGGGYRVFINSIGNVGSLNWCTPNAAARRVGTKYLSLFIWNRLKVVCTPAFIRVYSRDTLKEDIWPVNPTDSRIALFGSDAYFANMRISAQPLPIEGATIMPAPPKIVPEAYAFPAGADVTVQFDVLNYSTSNLVFSLATDHFDEASKKEIGQKTVPPSQFTPLRLSFELGKLPAALYQMHLACSFDGKPAVETTLPLAVLRSMGGKKEDYARPAISVAPYLKYMKYMQTKPPFYGNTYIYKILDDLRWYGINSMVAGMMKDEHLELCQRYGISVWDRGVPRNHPVVLGALIGDEPSKKGCEEYIKLYEEATAAQKDPDQKLVTCVIADYIDNDVYHFFWDLIKPKHRMIRIYGQTGCYKTSDNLTMLGKSTLSYPGKLKATQMYGDTSYTAILPTLGGRGFDAGYRDPTPAEMKVMMHLSLAYGAKNLLIYSYQQGEDIGGSSLVNSISIQPVDGKLEAAGLVARAIQPHEKLIKSLEPDQRHVYCTSPWMEAIPLRSGTNTYIYAVNRNVREETNAELFWDPECKLAAVHNLYANRDLRIFQSEFEDGKASDRVQLSLLPGDGALLAVTENK